MAGDVFVGARPLTTFVALHAEVVAGPSLGPGSSTSSPDETDLIALTKPLDLVVISDGGLRSYIYSSELGK